MTLEKILKLIMAHGRVSQKTIAKKLSKKAPSNFFATLYHKKTTFRTLVAVLDHLNYEIVFQPKGRSLPEYSYRITWEDYKNLPD